MSLYIGNSNVARNAKQMYIGVSNVARKASKAYIGINGVAQQFWPGSSDEPSGIFTKLPSPLEIPIAYTRDVDFSPDGTYLAVTLPNDSIGLIIYKRNGDILTKISNVESLSAGGYGVRFSPDGIHLAVRCSNNLVSIYKRNNDVFSKLVQLQTADAGSDSRICYSPDGKYLISGGHYPYIFIHKRINDTYTLLANPIDLPGNDIIGACFDPSSTYLAVSVRNMIPTVPHVLIYKRNGDNFTKIKEFRYSTNERQAQGSFSPDGIYLCMGFIGHRNLLVYKRNYDDFIQLTNTPTGGSSYEVLFDNTGKLLITTNSAGLYIYVRDGDTFTWIPEPTDNIGHMATGCSLTRDGKYLAVAHEITPFLTMYRQE